MGQAEADGQITAASELPSMATPKLVEQPHLRGQQARLVEAGQQRQAWKGAGHRAGSGCRLAGRRAGSAGVDQPAPLRLEDGLDAADHARVVEDGGHVHAHGVLGEAEMMGDDLVGAC